MKSNQFWNTVPKPVRTAALATIGIAVLLGLIVGGVQAWSGNQFVALGSLFGACIGVSMGSLVALFILCLGYVYADARRRAMPPVLWTLLALLVPNLLGFLFYFALRRPLISPCPQCGRPGESGRFCPSCGFDKLSAASGNAPSQAAYTGPKSSPA